MHARSLGQESTSSHIDILERFVMMWLLLTSVVLALDPNPNRLSPLKQNVLFCPLSSDLRTCWHLNLPSLILSSSHCSIHGSGSA